MSSSAHLIVDQHRYHRGFAKIRLQNLEFSEDAARPPLSQTNIDRLYKIFDLEGCQRLDPDNYVPVLVDHEVLGEALARTGVSEQQLLDPRSLPLLQLGGDSKALVLHGRHRLRAAEKFLTDSTEKWWTIDIFDSGEASTTRHLVPWR